jgi:glycosyltransferase-like protein
MRALSVGIFTYSAKPRGSVVHAAQLADALAAQGDDVTLYALDKDGRGFFRALHAARLVLIPARPAQAGSDALIAQRIEEVASFMLARAPRHDVLHAQDCLVASGLIAAAEARAQLHPHAAARRQLLCRTVHHVEQFESVYLERCQERSVHGADVCLSVSEATRRALRTRYGRESHVVLNGVDSARFVALSPAERAALRASLALPECAQLVLSVGGVEPRKNSLVMLEAFLALHARLPEARWLIAGGASIFEHAQYRAAFEARLAALSAVQRAAVLRLGVLPDDRLAALIGGSDVLLHASLQEGFGLCVLEAMAAGTPVVVSKGPPFDEFLDDGCALTVDPRDVAAMAGALLRALTGGGEVQAHAARKRARVFCWTRCAQRHRQIYLEYRGSPPRSRETRSP